jgi:hypothetical protein
MLGWLIGVIRKIMGNVGMVLMGLIRKSFGHVGWY